MRNVYNYYRTYDPSNGRYLESDPIGLAAGPNTYSYVRNMPTMLIDPLGLLDYLAYDSATGITTWYSGEEGLDTTDYASSSGTRRNQNPLLENGPTPPGLYTIEEKPFYDGRSSFCDGQNNCWFVPFVPKFQTPIDPNNGVQRCLHTSQGGTGRCGLHPDGNVPGTNGCVGLQDNDTSKFYDRLINFKPSPNNPLPFIVR